MWIEMLTIAFCWLSIAFGGYILYYLIGYIKDKPPGQQSLLDVLYTQLFKIWITIAIMVGINFTLVLIQHQSWLSAIVFGYGKSIIEFAGATHFILCGVFRFMLIFFPHKVEDFSENQIETGIW